MMRASGACGKQEWQGPLSAAIMLHHGRRLPDRKCREVMEALVAAPHRPEASTARSEYRNGRTVEKPKRYDVMSKSKSCAARGNWTG